MRKSDVAKALRARGFRLTAARWAIIRYLDGNRDHPTAQEIHEALLPEHPGLSLTTVYSTLSLLESVGAVAGMRSGPSGRRFDANPEPHVNLVCRFCGCVTDVEVDGLSPLVQQAARDAGFGIVDVTVEARGCCSDCRAAGKVSA